MRELNFSCLFYDGDCFSFLYLFEIERMIERKRRLNIRYP